MYADLIKFCLFVMLNTFRISFVIKRPADSVFEKTDMFKVNVCSDWLIFKVFAVEVSPTIFQRIKHLGGFVGLIKA